MTPRHWGDFDSRGSTAIGRANNDGTGVKHDFIKVINRFLLRCTGSSAQCEDRVARNAFNCSINTFFPGPAGPRGTSCNFINLWALKGDPPRLKRRRYEKGIYPGGPYGMQCVRRSG